MRDRFRAIVAVGVASTAVLLGVEAQEPAPTFRSSIEAVQIDVIVTDADGHPVSGLTVDDFELSEQGKPQPITTFQAVDIPIDAVEPVERSLGEPDVLRNDGPAGRVYLFALDEVRQENILRTRRFLREFINERFGPHDIGAIALLGRGLATDGQDFTSNRRLLLDAVEKFSGGFPEEAIPTNQCARGGGPGSIRGSREVPQLSDRSQQIVALRSLAEMMARIPGRHKAMLIFSECLDVDVLDIVDYRGGVLGLRGEDAHAAMAAATRSNLAIYPIDPTGVAGPLNAEGSFATMSARTAGAFRSLADATGGFAHLRSNAFTEAFERIVRENSTYYMLAFNSAYDRSDGRYVRVDVRVKRPGLTVRARAGYVAPTRQLRRDQERSRGASAQVLPVSAALATPFATNGIPIAVFAAPFKGRDRNALVALAIELQAASLNLKEEEGVLRGAVDLRYVATDARRRIHPEVAQTVSVEIRPDSSAALPLDQIRVRVVSELDLPEGRYQIRVAAGADVLAGSVVYDLDVPDFRDGPLALSGIALTMPAEAAVLTLAGVAAPAGRPVRCYSERCQPPIATAAGGVRPSGDASDEGERAGPSPTLQREFIAGDEVELRFEVYHNRRVRTADPPPEIAVSIGLRTADGGVVPLAEDRQPIAEIREGARGHAFRIPIWIPDEARPGAYALRVEARSGADAGDVVIREIAVRVR